MMISNGESSDHTRSIVIPSSEFEACKKKSEEAYLEGFKCSKKDLLLQSPLSLNYCRVFLYPKCLVNIS